MTLMTLMSLLTLFISSDHVVPACLIYNLDFYKTGNIGTVTGQVLLFLWLGMMMMIMLIDDVNCVNVVVIFKVPNFQLSYLSIFFLHFILVNKDHITYHFLFMHIFLLFYISIVLVDFFTSLALKFSFT